MTGNILGWCISAENRSMKLVSVPMLRMRWRALAADDDIDGCPHIHHQHPPPNENESRKNEEEKKQTPRSIHTPQHPPTPAGPLTPARPQIQTPHHITHKPKPTQTHPNPSRHPSTHPRTRAADEAEAEARLSVLVVRKTSSRSNRSCSNAAECSSR